MESGGGGGGGGRGVEPLMKDFTRGELGCCRRIDEGDDRGENEDDDVAGDDDEDGGVPSGGL